MMRLFGRTREPWWQQNVDAYIDGELGPRDRERFERALASEEVAAVLEARRALKAVIAESPPVEAPRSFRLTPAMVAAPPPARAKVQHVGWAPLAARAGAAMAALVLAVLVAVDISTGTSGSDPAASLADTRVAAKSLAPGEPAAGAGAAMTTAGGAAEHAPVADGATGAATVPAGNGYSQSAPAQVQPPANAGPATVAASAASPALRDQSAPHTLDAAASRPNAATRGRGGTSGLRIAEAGAGAAIVALGALSLVLARRRKEEWE